MTSETFEKVEIVAAQDLWDWLASNQKQATSVWLVTWKAADRSKYVSRDEVLDALVAYGWIDGRRMAVDEARTMQMISPRKQQAWAQTYKNRAKKLEDEGRMRAPGRAAIAASKREGKWDAMTHVDRLEMPEDLLEALRSRNALGWWNTAAPSYRRNVLRWIETAKKTPTRNKRIETVALAAAKGHKVPNY